VPRKEDSGSWASLNEARATFTGSPRKAIISILSLNFRFIV